MCKNNIPSFWTAEEALTLCAFLETLASAIWNTHGHAMAKHLQRIQHLQNIKSRLNIDPPQDDDDIPF